MTMTIVTRRDEKRPRFELQLNTRFLKGAALEGVTLEGGASPDTLGTSPPSMRAPRETNCDNS